MPVLSIQYDLYKEPGRVYDQLIAAIKKFSAWCHATESCWFIVTDASPKDVYEYLKPYLHTKDKVLVTPVRLDGGWWAQGLPRDVLDWLTATLTTRRAG